MRICPPKFGQVWHSGDYTGENRPIARATLQQGNVNLYQISANKIANLYASLIFGPQVPPKEMPNLKSVVWSRNAETETATGTLVFYNTKPLRIGETPTRDLDGLGYYTYNRGQTSFANRWGQTPNEWANLLMPDNLIRTYEGYGVDPTVPPEKDKNLLQSGFWIIDDVVYDHLGLITVTVSDISRVLNQQIIFPPVIPQAFYPLSFAGVPQHSGVVAPTTFTYTTDATGGADPAHPPPPGWTGPLDPPLNVVVTAGDNNVHVTWSRPATLDRQPTGTVTAAGKITGPTPTKGYAVAGYQLVVDGIRLPTVYAKTTFSASVPAREIVNGNVYSVNVVATWRLLLNKAGEIYFKTNVEQQVISRDSTITMARPGIGGAQVTPGSIATNHGANLELAPGFVHFAYSDGGNAINWTLIAYHKGGAAGHTYSVHTSPGAGSAAFDTGTELGNLDEWNFLIFGQPDSVASSQATTQTYPGDVFFAKTPANGGYYAGPVDGAPPHNPGPAPTGPTVTKGTTIVPLDAAKIGARYDDSSNSYYVGRGAGVSVYGHEPYMAFDSDLESYWLSIGNDTPSAGYSFEWIQAAVDNVTVTQVKFTTKLANYEVYVSVYARGVWVRSAPNDVIPYDPRNPQSHNGGNIPYVVYTTPGSSEGPHTVTLPVPIVGATKVRLTFHNIQDFGVGGIEKWRAGCKNFAVFGQSVSSTSTVKPAPVVVGSAQDNNAPDLTSSYTVYTPAHIEPGAGENPGTYEDYTDIVKLFCAWGGFYWPEAAREILSDGTEVQYDFGVDPHYGLPNVDPVLGTAGAGRVWGDFEQTGTHGPALIPVQQWDKKSLLDGINFIKEIIGYLFFIDEQGAVVWRNPNVFSVGNTVGNLAATAGRTSDMVQIDERQTLIGLRAKLSGRNVRERNFIASVNGRFGALARGYNPNPIGLRRVGGWTDQHFLSTAECQVMADLISIRQLFTYRTDQLTIPGYPVIQVDDQVRIFEQVTGEGFIHYVKGIQSSLDMEAGAWNYTLDTYWLGETPFTSWAFDPKNLAPETQTYLDALAKPAGAALPQGTVF